MTEYQEESLQRVCELAIQQLLAAHHKDFIFVHRCISLQGTWLIGIDYRGRFISLHNRTGKTIKIEYANPKFFELLSQSITTFINGKEKV